ncbi:carbohydrate ABC transporter permease [Cellulosilyticum ruminicola]|uniref:carbohydrate ABC transporter permease n=1 Tax=Cellulosilyticum ruminicola TaxID=425254 RepID=UPI0006D0E9C7|nr:sugar ABC transporter permease [Cellulosilyticum ruminicola]
MQIKVQTDGSSRKQVLISSILFMGLGHILYLKEYVKGVFYALIEVCMLLCSPMIMSKLINLVTLGNSQPNLPVKQRDNSIFMLIDGVIILAVICVFIAIYIISVRSALKSYEEYCIFGWLKNEKNIISDTAQKAFPILALAPTVGLVLFFVVVPLIFSACVAFTNYAAPDHIPPNNTVDWVGFANFKAMFVGGTAWSTGFVRVAIWTLVWGALATFTCYFGGMIMAVSLNQSKLKLAPVFRTIFILPYAVPAVVSMLVWNNLLNGSFGVVNRTLIALNITSAGVPWLSNAWLAKFVCVLINLWAGFPYFMLLITGSMTAISADIYEAAKIDGANQFQIFKKMILPIVLYQTTPLIIMSFTHNINNFGAIFFLTNGYPVVADSTTTGAGGTDILVTWIYKLTVNLLKYNYAAVLAIVIFVVLAPFAIYNFRNTKAYKDGEM